jgi:hypothetical protein
LFEERGWWKVASHCKKRLVLFQVTFKAKRFCIAFYESYPYTHKGIKYLEAHTRLLFGSHETSPIIWIGKPAPAMYIVSSEKINDRKEPNTAVVAGGEGVKTTESKIRWPRCFYASSPPPPPTQRPPPHRSGIEVENTGKRKSNL